MSTAHEPLEEYDGPATLLAGDTCEDVEVRLRGHFEPIDGSFHWYGRVSAEGLSERHDNGAAVVVRTPHGQAEAKLSDLDPWGRFRLTGRGRPPF
jgi:hypothetical protein